MTNLFGKDYATLYDFKVDLLAAQPPVVATSAVVPLFGTCRAHEQQNWLADFADPAKVLPRAVPWTLTAPVLPMNGVKPARVRAWHTFGQTPELYSEIPYVVNGRSDPYSPQVGDQIPAIVADLQARPLPDGPRGIAILSPYGTAISHPYARPDGTLIDHAPVWLWIRHDAVVQLLMPDGSVQTAGRIPGITQSYDCCVDETNRKILYVADIGNKRVAKVDRATGAQVFPVLEDASKYIVTDYLDAVSPTAVRTDEAGNVYTVAGVIYKNLSPLCAIPNAFACDYYAGSLYVATDGGICYQVDTASGAYKQLFAGVGATAGGYPLGSMFVTISVDTGTFGPAGAVNVTRSHGAGNIDHWIYTPGSGVQTLQAHYNAGLGYLSCGDALTVHEIAGHYPWAGKHHRYQARMLLAGFTGMPFELVAYKTANEVPAEDVHDYSLSRRAQKVIRKGGSDAAPFDIPSLTCLITREGWSSFKDCSADEIAEMPFATAEAWIKGGLAGAYPRSLDGLDLYALLVYLYRNSQRFLREGKPLMDSLNAYWGARPRPVVPEPVVGESAKYLEVRNGVVVVTDLYGNLLADTPPPAQIVSDRGTFRAMAVGWATRAT